MRNAFITTLLIGQTVLVQANAGTNAVPFVPASAIAAARSPVRQPDLDRIATNTSAFEEYGFNLMLSQADFTREAWKLNMPHPLQVNEVLFSLKATAFGMEGALGTRNKRYTWAFANGWMNLFRDNENSSRAYLVNANGYDVLEAMAKAKSKITEEKAIEMARDYLHAIGLTEKQLRLHEPPAVEQDPFTNEKTGRKYKVPLFTVGWSVEGANPDAQLVKITVSGITSNIVEYFNANPNTPRTPMPTNYFQMLGLPTNYLETLSPRLRRQFGLPPLTKPPDHVTNSAK